MQLESYALGRHLLFMRDGDTYTIPGPGGTASRTSKPDATDPAYIDLGAIEDWELDIKAGKTEEIWAPSPGAMQLKNEIDTKQKMMLKVTTSEIGALGWEIFNRTSQKLTSAGGQFNPLAAQPRRGWAHTELYDANNNFVEALDLYGRLRITGSFASKEGAVIRPQWEFTVYYSTLNTGLLSTT